MLAIGGMNVSQLLNSKIFYSRIDFDGWPLVSDVDNEVKVPYNGSLFDIRENYQQVWKDHPEILKRRESNEHHQITYKLNLLPGVLQCADADLMQVVGNVDSCNMDIFDAMAM